jgi:hypothetical protein
LLLIAGGSGLVPLMAMLRHRAAAASTVDARLLLSACWLEDVLYRGSVTPPLRSGPSDSAPRAGLGSQRKRRFGRLTRRGPSGLSADVIDSPRTPIGSRWQFIQNRAIGVLPVSSYSGIPR